MFLITFTFVGPVSFVPIAPSEHLIQVMPMRLMDNPDRQPDIWLELPIITIQAMMALAGFAYSALVCSSFSRAQKRVIEMGFSDDINTYVMISGGVDAPCLP